jgi:secondary thiamine-phosphate synthase enzyme
MRRDDAAAGAARGPDPRGRAPDRILDAAVRTTEFELDTRGRRIVDITDEVARAVAEDGGSGLVNVFVPHATAGLALMETGSGSEGDLQEALERLLPRDDRYAHRHGSVGHGGDHLLPVFVAPSLVLQAEAGRLVLGTWQRVVVVDPNRENNVRRVRVSVLAG